MSRLQNISKRTTDFARDFPMKFLILFACFYGHSATRSRPAPRDSRAARDHRGARVDGPQQTSARKTDGAPFTGLSPSSPSVLTPTASPC